MFITKPFKQNEDIKDADSVYNKMKELFNSFSLIQLGGGETLGKGLMRVNFNEGNKQQSHKE